MTTEEKIEEAVDNFMNEYQPLINDEVGWQVVNEIFKAGAKSEAAKEYWFEQFKQEQNDNIN